MRPHQTVESEFPTATEGLPDAQPVERRQLVHGDEVTLEIAPVKKEIGGAVVRMLAYNGSVPGPTLVAPQGATITVHVTNQGDLDATVHWHGLRLENRFDGTHETQSPIPVGESFTYQIALPDPGVYWYHPHIREDYGQEMGLYGNIVVVPSDPDYWPPADREIPLTLDDILIEDGKVAPFSESETTHVAMGRFGNVMLVAGESDCSLDAGVGEVVRLYLTNTANTRVFNVALPGARMKLVGGDSGHYEHEQLIEEMLLAPSERVVVDVLFDQPGEYILEHRTPQHTYSLATMTVSEGHAKPRFSEAFGSMRTNEPMVAERERIQRYLSTPPDKTLAFVAEMNIAPPEGDVVYACPMHPEVVSDEPGSCPEVWDEAARNGGARRSDLRLPDASSRHERPARSLSRVRNEARSISPCLRDGSRARARPDHDEHGHEHQHADVHEHGHADAHEHHEMGHAHDTAQGIEWEDDMVEVNRITTPANMRWKLIDRTTGAENAAIDWQFRVGDQVKIRLLNEMDSDHPMPHPFHIHGAGRFLILSRDGVTEPNLVWKDTVLVRTGETVDILLDVTNPGVWMAHCHIAEHHESGMMFSFQVHDAI